MPVMTFLESYDFSEKTVISFSSHGGIRYGDSVFDLEKKSRTHILDFHLNFIMVAVGIWNQELTNGSRTADYNGHLNRL